ncbi:MAG: hypothetical protein V4564_21995 [Pseudomonadota bacterium]|uniref:hypothetical protein n=1 Tax=Sphingomonas sp. ERG5 TaxID=1381597 RepID=UPI00054C723B|nr:hypothetical protein [Sphingomonas sp. ERG5]
MKFALVIIILAAIVAIIYFTMRSHAPRRKRSQFFSHTFDNSGAGKVPDAPSADGDSSLKP